MLCPRGGGPSTLRLFETMMLGRSPVIISDQWVPPAGPRWEEFSVRVAEDSVPAIGDVLRERAPEAAKMGELARAEWLEWFAPDVAFHRIAESLLELVAAAGARRGPRRHAPRAQMLRPYHAARWVAKRLGYQRRFDR